MPTVQMLLLTPSGRFRKKKAKITSDHPNHLRNFSDNQSYTMDENPVFAFTRPMVVNSYEDLLEALPNHTERVPEQYMAISEDNNPWPLSTNVVLSKEQFLLRQRKREDFREEGVIYAQNAAIREGLGNPFQNMAFISLTVVFCIIALIAAAIIAQVGLKPTLETPVDPAALLPIMLGTIALGRAKTRSERRSKIYRELVYLYDCEDNAVKIYLAPYDVLAARFSDCRYVPDIRVYRIIGAILFPAILVSLAFTTLYFTIPNPILAAIATFPVALFTPLIGWAVGPAMIMSFSPLARPFWLLYRRKVETEDGEVTLLAPIRHTYGRGVDPMIYDIIKDEILADQRMEAESLGIEPDEMPEYQPTVNRATDLHENLEGRIHKEQDRIPRPFKDALQIGGIAMMVLFSLGILLFIVLALSE